MIFERYMVSAVPVGGGERVTGYIIAAAGRPVYLLTDCYAQITNGQWYVRADLGGGEYAESFEVNPDTIEPVRVPITEDGYTGNGICPSCRNIVEEDQSFCDRCGMALEWPDGKDVEP